MECYYIIDQWFSLEVCVGFQSFILKGLLERTLEEPGEMSASTFVGKYLSSFATTPPPLKTSCILPISVFLPDLVIPPT